MSASYYSKHFVVVIDTCVTIRKQKQEGAKWDKELIAELGIRQHDPESDFIITEPPWNSAPAPGANCLQTHRSGLTYTLDKLHLG